jgi:hypothetical protein
VDSVRGEALGAISLNFPEGVGVCFASVFWPEETNPLPGSLKEGLVFGGWTLYDPRVPPDPPAVLVFVSEPWSTEGESTIAAGYQVWELGEEEVVVWGDQWDFRLECRRGRCSIARAPGGSHYDVRPVPVDEYMARERGVCSGSVPGRWEEGGESSERAAEGRGP